jgi:hypothetical protein
MRKIKIKNFSSYWQKSRWQATYSKSFKQRLFFLQDIKIPTKWWLLILIILFLISSSIIFLFAFSGLRYSLPLVNNFSRSNKIGRAADFCLTNPTSTLFAVVIDNEIHSRPPMGLSNAQIVYEAPAEAGITRFLAVYCYSPRLNYNKGDFTIGPIRSLRPYFLEWAEELNAPIVHVGGSPEALEKLKNSNIPDLNQYYNGGYFWRDSIRVAPHNVFTNLKKLSEFLKNKFPSFEEEHQVWNYNTNALRSQDNVADSSVKSVNSSVESVIIDYLRPEHLVKWVYDKNTNFYFRFQGNAEHKDADGSKISAKNIVIQITDIEVVDEIGRRRIKTTGEGKTIIFQNGKIIRGIWKKPTKNSLTRFYNSTGEEIKFNKGSTWIEIVSENHKITVGN